MLQRILVGLDGSPLAETILPYVTTLAQRLSADVTLLRVVPLPEEVREGEHRATLEQLLQRAETYAQDYLTEVARRLAGTGLSVRTALRVGNPTGEIIQVVEQEGSELIALATHGRSGLQRWVHGSVADGVLHTAGTPLLLIRPGEGDEGPGEVRQVVVPLDGSALAEAVLPVAELLASGFAVPLMVVRVIQPLLLGIDPEEAGPAYADTMESIRAAAVRYLEQRAAELRDRGQSVSIAVPTGDPAAEIVQYIQEHPGTLVVMGTQGRTGLAGLVLGSVTRRVVQQAEAPVLVVRAGTAAEG